MANNETEKRSADLMKEWLGLLDDKERAEVLKAQIAEEAKTERLRIEHDADTRKRLHQTEGFHLVRGMFIVFLFAVAAMGTCLGHNHIEKRAALDLLRIQAEHPGTVLPAASVAAPAVQPAGPVRYKVP